MSGREAFGPGLRAHRERHGLTLESIAKSTKIKASLLAALERNDVSQWPAGIFRRAFLRSYADAVGLAPEPLVADFQRYFPEEGAPDPACWGDDELLSSPRLELAEPRSNGGLIRERAGSAVLEALLVVAIGGAISTILGTGVVVTAGVSALLYYPIATALTGRTVRRTHLRLPAWTRWADPGESAAAAAAHEPPQELMLERSDTAAETADPRDEFRPPQAAIH